MLCITAHHGPQGVAQALRRASHAHNCGIDYEAVELAQEIRHAQHGPPYHKLIDLSNIIELKTRQRPPDQGHKAGRTSAVEPVRVKADCGLGVEGFEQQKETQRCEAQHPHGAGNVPQSIWDKFHAAWKVLIQVAGKAAVKNHAAAGKAHASRIVPGAPMAARAAALAPSPE